MLYGARRPEPRDRENHAALTSRPVPFPLIVGEGERGAHAMEYRVYGLVASAFTIGCTIFFN